LKTPTLAGSNKKDSKEGSVGGEPLGARTKPNSATSKKGEGFLGMFEKTQIIGDRKRALLKVE